MAWVVAVTCAACGGDSGSDDAGAPGEVDGALVYSQPQPDGNTFACGTCHAIEEPAADGLRRPGHPIGDAPFRPSFKNGRQPTFLGAVNTCLSEWMTVQQPWTEATPRFVALREYLEGETSSSTASELEFDIVQPPTNADELLSGDPQAGQTLFNESCVVCHGTDGAGTQRAPEITGRGLEPSYIAERIRLSGFLGSATYDGLTGGRMPFWSQQRLSDDEVLDLTAYVAMSPSGSGGSGGTGGAGGAGGSGGTAGSGGGVGLRDCPSTHPKVGQVAILQGFSHDVAGTATIVDDCTIRVDDFSFDGGGIDVRAYPAAGGNYVATGFAISENLVGPPLEDATITWQLPENRSLDDVDGLSIWCVPVGVSFGDGLFQ